MSVGYGASVGLENVLARLFQEQSEKQRIAEQAKRFEIEQAKMGEDTRQFNANLGQRDKEFGHNVDEDLYQRPITAGNLAVSQGNLGLREKEFAHGQNVDAATAAWKGTDLANQNNENALTRASNLRIANIRAQDSGEPLVSVAGPDGKPVLVPRSQAAGMSPVTATKPTLGIERSSLSFYNRAKEAVEAMSQPDASGSSLESRISGQGIARQLQGQLAPNMVQTTDQQRYRQAQRAFTEARLRKESGAAIAPLEYENDAKTYFMQPGDDPKTSQQKAKLRQDVLDGLKFQAGRAFNEFYGDQPGETKPSGPEIGARRVINGVQAEWDGKGWKAVQ